MKKYNTANRENVQYGLENESIFKLSAKKLCSCTILILSFCLNKPERHAAINNGAYFTLLFSSVKLKVSPLYL